VRELHGHARQKQVDRPHRFAQRFPQFPPEHQRRLRVNAGDQPLRLRNLGVFGDSAAGAHDDCPVSQRIGLFEVVGGELQVLPSGRLGVSAAELPDKSNPPAHLALLERRLGSHDLDLAGLDS
jgi:hypothetical protein